MALELHNMYLFGYNFDESSLHRMTFSCGVIFLIGCQDHLMINYRYYNFRFNRSIHIEHHILEHAIY
jgi:hypothetical protein